MPLSPIQPVPWTRVTIDGGFWGQKWELNRTVTLPLEFEQCERTGALTAYQWDENNLPEREWRIWVGDIAKWLEAASYTLGVVRDDKLAALARTAADHIIKGQKPDGYLYANPIAPDQRWTNLQEKHELYDVGHVMESAAAYHHATGDTSLLDALCRCADLLDAKFGPEPGKSKGYDGHQEVELALVSLYRASGEKRYLNLAKHFLDERGRQPFYFDLEREEWKRLGIKGHGWGVKGEYTQAHKPVREQEDAVGHSVRAMYMYCGMADVGVETGDETLIDACRTLWRSTVRKRMYVTGGIGSTGQGEAFTFDYDLPNETAYAETCAAIGLVLFAHRMLAVEADSEYADVMERALYNGVLSGIGLDGKRFFYANHLTVFPQPDSAKRSDAVALTRQEWFGCACCPPNIARLIAGIGRHIYAQRGDTAFVHLYAQTSASLEIAGRRVKLSQETQYPWREKVLLRVEPESETAFTLALRLPGWCRKPSIKINGKTVNSRTMTKKGYAHLRRKWNPGDVVELTLPMPAERVEAHPNVRMDCNKVALQRGPVVYCIEQADNGVNLADLRLPRASKLTAQYKPGFLGGCVVLRGRAERRENNGWTNRLYNHDRTKRKAVTLTAVPYHLWANRKPGEMLVWMNAD
ncbi:MAG: glycoside hydrolase family 127 protein [Planctomycetes bacterium]|nr:glycoside hydrolase family 127 protein [Planctomycetota bacterium]